MDKQSPINLELKNITNHCSEELAFHWHIFDAHLEDTGYLIRAYGHGGYVVFKGYQFDFVEFHFHTPSEHRINHQQYPMEIHFVHYHKKLDQYVVIAILVETATFCSELQKIIDALPYLGQDKSITINLNLFLPKNLTTFHYDGSLTTPPCTENVSWQIFCSLHCAHQQQIDAIRAIRDNNAREIQALNHRTIIKQER